MLAATNCYITLRSEGVTVLIDASSGRLPTLLYWGADLGDVTAEDITALAGHRPDTLQHESGAPPAILPEQWRGWAGRPGISGSRAGTAWSPRFTSTQVRIDGITTPAAGDVAATVLAAGAGLVEIDAEDPVSQLTVTVTCTLQAGGVLATQVRLTNRGADTYDLHELVMAYPIPQTAREVLDLAGRWGKERTPQRHPLGVGTHLREGRRGRTGADAATVLHVGTPGFSFGSGEVWGVHAGWSGNHIHYAERLSTGAQVIGGGELLLPGEVRLAPGDTYETPWVYGSYGHGLDQVARRFHRFLRARDHHPGVDRPVTVNVWEAVYFDHNLDRLLHLAQTAADVGVERFVLDDGWFGARRHERAGLGDWTVADDVWPEGLHPLVDQVRALGMEFGLWVEPEMVNPDSDLARAHPEWIMATGQQWPIERRHQQVLNLGIPECYAYIRDALLTLLDEYDIGYLKWDHNRDLIDAGTQPTGAPGVHAQTLAFYRLVDELKTLHPGLEIESCSSGGARVDLGVLSRTDRIWVSDNIDPVDRQQMNRWTTQLVPPEMMGSHIASGHSHTTGRRHELNFRAATAVFGHLGVEWDLTQINDEERRELAAWIAFYKQQRALLFDGDLVRLDFPDDALVAHGVIAPDRSRALYSFAVMSRSDVSEFGRIRLPGLAADRRYRVTPVLVGRPPEGLTSPAWWGLRNSDAHPEPAPEDWAGISADGVTLSGAALGKAGLELPGLYPEHCVLMRAELADD